MTNPARSRLQRNLIVCLQVLVGGALLVWLLTLVDFGRLATLTPRQGAGLAVATLVVIATILFESYRVSQLAGDPPSFGEVNRMTIISYFFTNILPTTIGGDGYKVFHLRRYKGIAGASLLVLADRASGLAVLLGVCLPLVAFLPPPLPSMLPAGMEIPVPGLWAVLAVIATAALLMLWPGLRQQVQRLARYLAGLFSASGRGTAPRYFAAIGLFHLVRCWAMILMLQVLGQQLNLAQAWLILTFTAIVSMIPLSVAGLGLREAAFVAAMAPLGIGTTDAMLCALLFRLANLLQGIAGGVLLLASGHAWRPRPAP